MYTSFTDWESGIYLEHYGVPGMKWGVRRYMNKDGSLTASGRKRYASQLSRTSASKMTSDFNNLDKSYANVVARHQTNMSKTAKFARKGHRLEAKGKRAKAAKQLAKSLKYGKMAAENNQQKKGIESLQWRIIGAAARNGYTTRGKAVSREGSDGKFFNERKIKVDGQNINITRHGNGGTQVVNYNNASQIAREDREKERRRQMANARRG